MPHNTILPAGASGGTPAPASDWTRADWSLATVQDPNGMAGGTLSLGETCLFDVGAVHGNVDATMDAWIATLDIGPPPTGKRTLILRATCASTPAGDPGGGWAHLLFAAGSTSTPTSAKALYSGWNRSWHPANYSTNATAFGTGPGASVVLGNEPLVCTETFAFDSATASTGMTVATYGDNLAHVQAIANNITPYTNVYLYVAMCHTGTSGLASVQWPNVSVDYMWV